MPTVTSSASPTFLLSVTSDVPCATVGLLPLSARLSRSPGPPREPVPGGEVSPLRRGPTLMSSVGGGAAARRRADDRRGGEAGRDLGAGLPPLAQPVRRDEGQRRQAAARAGARERASEAERRHQGTGDRRAQGDRAEGYAGPVPREVQRRTRGGPNGPAMVQNRSKSACAAPAIGRFPRRRLGQETADSIRFARHLDQIWTEIAHASL